MKPNVTLLAALLLAPLVLRADPVQPLTTDVFAAGQDGVHTYRIPAMVLFHVLGVPDRDVAQVKAWAGNRIELYYGRPTAAEISAINLAVNA